jgi:hypothetical protein
MPYIKQYKRDVLDSAINEVVNALRELESDDPANSFAGNLNYLISSILYKSYGDQPRYDDINEIVGMLECCKLEFYRRIAAPYEDIKTKENGDVYSS